MSLIDMLMTQEARIKPFERYAGGKALYGSKKYENAGWSSGKRRKSSIKILTDLLPRPWPLR